MVHISFWLMLMMLMYRVEACILLKKHKLFYNCLLGAWTSSKC